MTLTKKKRAKLSPRERALAAEYIPIEHQSFPRRQAVAVGISLARRQAAKEKLSRIINKHLKHSK